MTSFALILRTSHLNSSDLLLKCYPGNFKAPIRQHSLRDLVKNRCQERNSRTPPGASERGRIKSVLDFLFLGRDTALNLLPRPELWRTKRCEVQPVAGADPAVGSAIYITSTEHRRLWKGASGR